VVATHVEEVHHYIVKSEADFPGLMGAYTAALIARAPSLLVHIEAGTYHQKLWLGMLSETRLNVRVEGAGAVWFEGASVEVNGADVTVSGIGFRGVSPPGSLLSVRAAGDVRLGSLRFDGVHLGDPGAKLKPTTIPSYLIEVSTRGEGVLTLEDVDIQDVSMGPPALIGLQTRPLRTPQITGLQVLRTQADVVVLASPAGDVLFQAVRAHVPKSGVFMWDPLGMQQTTITNSRIIVDDPEHLVDGRPPTLNDTLVWGRLRLGPGWRSGTAAESEFDGF
jgi:hypothetical protein